MRKALPALLVLAILSAGPALAQRSRGCFMNGQQVDDCVCSGTCSSQQSAGSSASAPAGLSPAQEVFVNGMGAIWSQIIKDATKPRAPAAPAGPTPEQKQAELQRQAAERQRQEEALQRQREAERAAAERREKEEMAEHLDGKLKLDSDQRSDVSAGLKMGESAEPAPASPERNQARALDCALADVYGAAAALGAGGAKFAAGLRSQIAAAKEQLPKGLPKGAPNTCAIVTLSRESLEDDGIRGDWRMNVRAQVTRLQDTGQTQVNLIYSLSKGKKTSREGQEMIVLDSAGEVDCQQATTGTAKCMAQLEPKAGARDYCPKPAPERKPPYPACETPGEAARAPAPGAGPIVDGLPLK